MALGHGPQLADVHRLPQIHLHVPSGPVGEGDRVLGLPGMVRPDPFVDLGRALHAAPEVFAEPRLGDLRRRVVAVGGGEVLPFLAEQAVPLQIAVGAQVADDVERVIDLLQRAAGLFAPVPPALHVGVQHFLPAFVRQPRRQFPQLRQRVRRVRVEDGGDDPFFRLLVVVHQRHRRPLPHRLGHRLRGQRPGLVEGLGEVRARLRPLHERRDQRVEFLVDGVSEAAKLGEVAGVGLRQQVLEGLSHSEQPDVGAGGRRQVAAQEIAGMGAHGGPVGGLRPLGELPVAPGLGVGDGVAGARVTQLRVLQRNGLADMLDHRLHLPRIGFEQELHDLDIVPAVPRFGQGRLDEVEVAAVPVLAVEAHVASGLFKRRDADARVLEVLGGYVGDPFAGHVGAAELRHRVVAVTDEHAVIEGARAAHRRIVAAGRSRAVQHHGEVGVAEELVQERAPEVPGRAAVAGEERAGHLLGQPQPEDRPVHVGEEWREPLAFRRSEVFHGDSRRISVVRPKTNQSSENRPKTASRSLCAAGIIWQT